MWRARLMATASSCCCLLERLVRRRDPLPREVEAFMPCLFKQIAIIKPKLIVTLGRFAANVFLPNLRISQDHGQPRVIHLKGDNLPLDELIILPLYHPAAALYNGGMRQTLENDFGQIPTILSKIK